MSAPWTAALALTLAAVALASGARAEDPLASYRGRHRLLVVFAPAPDSAPLREQERLIAGEQQAFQERDLLVVRAVGEVAPAASFRRRFGVKTGDFAAILVGKDGTEKLRSTQPISPERLYGTIDAMPMRQQEMKDRQ